MCPTKISKHLLLTRSKAIIVSIARLSRSPKIPPVPILRNINFHEEEEEEEDEEEEEEEEENDDKETAYTASTDLCGDNYRDRYLLIVWIPYCILLYFIASNVWSKAPSRFSSSAASSCSFSSVSSSSSSSSSNRWRFHAHALRENSLLTQKTIRSFIRSSRSQTSKPVRESCTSLILLLLLLLLVSRWLQILFLFSVDCHGENNRSAY